jgi:quinol monooxygenase YgiN
MTGPVSVLATFSVGAQRAEELRAALRELVSHVECEAGTELFEVNEDPDQPGDFVIFERYRDDAAVAEHRGSAAMAEFRSALGTIEARPQIRFLQSVAAIGRPANHGEPNTSEPGVRAGN